MLRLPETGRESSIFDVYDGRCGVMCDGHVLYYVKLSVTGSNYRQCKRMAMESNADV